MNAVPKINAVPKPATVADLEAELQRISSDLTMARRSQSRQRTELPRLLAANDVPGTARLRGDLAVWDAAVSRLGSELEDVREALRIAKARDREAAQTRIYKEIEQSARVREREQIALADAIEAFGQAFSAARTGLQALAAQTTRAGVPPDPYAPPHQTYGRLPEATESALFLATGGVIGKSRSLNGTDQLAQGVTGGSVIRHMAGESLALTMHRTRSALNITQEHR